MEIILAKNIGFCFGVKRAMDLVTAHLNKSKEPVYTLGPLIHNPQVMEKLEKENLVCVSKIEQIKKRGKVFIRSHGVPREILTKLKRKKLKIIDATCPYVKRIQHLVNNLAKKNYTIIIFGKRNHPEVEALVSYAQGKAKVIEKVEDLTRQISGANKKIGLVAQTTQATEDFQKIISFFQSPLFQNKEVKIYNTLCPTTKKRQTEAEKIARETDLVFVIGGKNSSNTTRLAEICSRYQRNTFHIETAEEIDLKNFKRKTKIGIITGASTPEWIIKEVVERVKKSILGG
jgi:4-hydroxy-3-methylbut-2-enyl diphosphate reductase